MGATSIIGAQWGDEGKGKITAMLAQNAKAVVRYHGGNNAGHTLYHNGVKFASHLVPSGVFNPNAMLFIGRGTVLDLAVLNKEIADLKAIGVDLTGRLFISPGCSIIMPYHKELERLIEEAKGAGKTGTTLRGIGPCHADKVSYNSIRLSDFSDRSFLLSKIELQLAIKNKMIIGLGGQPLDEMHVYSKLINDFFRFGLDEMVKEPRSEILRMIKNGERVLFEGAHGVLLDNEWGTYPFVTASGVVAGNINGGAGIPLSNIDRVIGVTKAYQTRVGNGPFPTELLDATGDKLRSDGAERGTTTGRDRRCGWLDLVLEKYSVEVAGITELAITKLDILDDFDEIKVCVAYHLANGFPMSGGVDELSSSELFLVRPVYTTLPGWKRSTKNARVWSDLPDQAQNYLKKIESYVGVPIKMVSVGPNDEETILV